MTLLSMLLLILVGLSGGLIVGAGLVALITVLGLVPRLTQITKTNRFVHLYQYGIVTGSVFWGWVGMHDISFTLPYHLSAVHGLFAGLFVGMLAAALTEVLNVLPILAKRINLVDKIIWLLMAMVLGKIVGSLFHWLYFAPLSLS